MSVVEQVKQATAQAINQLYNVEVAENDIQVNATKPEFEGDYTVVLFGFIKQLKKSPEVLGNDIGNYLVQQNSGLFTSFNIIKGFLNLVITDAWWLNFLQANYNNVAFGKKEPNGQKVMVEYSSPNTNKPLHLGHLRNNFLGWSTAAILKANGYDIIKTCIVNDRGIHICKSMIAWQLFANGATPASTGIKGDHFVGDYYVKFNDELKRQSKPYLELIYSKNDLSSFSQEEKQKLTIYLSKINELEAALAKAVSSIDFEAIKKFGNQAYAYFESATNGSTKWKAVSKCFDEDEYNNLELKEKEEKQKQLNKIIRPVITIEEKIDEHRSEITDIAQNKTGIMKGAQEMLLEWEAGKPEVVELWKTMNSWVYAGFDVTYKKIGSDFDRVYYESETYLLGKGLVEDGLKKGVFYKKDDGSVWIDLTADGLDEKLVMRRDGTSVYITQDIGLAVNKYKEYKYNQSIYVVGDEQIYHFKVLKLICQKLGLPSADGIYHLSYGMVELPGGKMKSREGTVVDADDMIAEMISIAQQKTEELGKVKDFTTDELKELYNTLGLGALKFFLLRVDPKKRMVFNPEESIDFHGFTGPFIQYTHARIKSILRKQADNTWQSTNNNNNGLLPLEKMLVTQLEQFFTIINEAANEHDPSRLAIYIFNLAKTFSSFYTEHSIMSAESEEKKVLRLKLAQLTAHTIKTGMELLGIKVPERM